MATKQQLQELLERVEKAEGPDRWLDESIHVITISGIGAAVVDARGGFAPNEAIPRYTASLDTAISLCEAVLPGNGLEIELEIFYGGKSVVCGEMRWAFVSFYDWKGVVYYSKIGGFHASSAPLALITATLKALVKLKEN